MRPYLGILPDMYCLCALLHLGDLECLNPGHKSLCVEYGLLPKGRDFSPENATFTLHVWIVQI